ncbi:hypothetical protein ATCC90586_007250 [Pythium insidiosum]|nr:hypothetical protein ATCC90586_007250 [Pythium insidiosum]
MTMAEQQQRSQSFSHPPRPPQDPQLQPSLSLHPAPPPQQQHHHHNHQQLATAAARDAALHPRPSPFASSGPVAMVSQIRPGAVPGQFPGVPVRATPSQLSTPLVAARRASALDPAPQQLFPPAQPPPSDLFPRVERAAAAEALVGASPPPSSTSSRTQSMESLFGVSDASAASLFPPPPPPPTQAPQAPGLPPVRSTQSFSFGQADDRPQTRAFSHSTPPPAAPFLGYADASRAQSFRSVPNSPSEYQRAPSLHQRSSSSGSFSAPLASPPRVHAAVRSADELVEEFLRVSLEDQYLLETQPQSGAATPPPPPPPKRLTLADIPDRVDSLEQLYREKRWKTLTKKALAMLQTPCNDATRTLEIKSWWLAGLIKEGQYDNATSVLDQIGDLDDVASAVASSGGESFVAMRLRLLDALLSKYRGQSADHEKKLFALIAKIQRATTEPSELDLLGVSSAAAARRWLRVAQLALVNHLVHQHKFSLALRLCATMETQDMGALERVLHLSRLGRVHLQMGDLARAEQLFSRARQLAESAQLRRGAEARLLLNDGLLLFAQNKLQEALSAFDAVLHLEDDSGAADDPLCAVDEDVRCVAVNNLAICALYCCDVKGAVAALERVIRSHPARFLNAVVVFNLSSLYDLVFDNPTSTSRKEMMKKVAELYDLEHIDPAAFRI